jgi:predicted HTH domain antitoxin
VSTKLTIPDDVLQAAGLTERECLVGLAVHLYTERRVTIAQAVRLSGLTRSELEEELARRNISLYSVDDLRRDVSDPEKLGRL